MAALMGNDGQADYSATVTAIFVLEGLGIGLGLIFLLVTLTHHVFIAKLNSIYIVIQSQACLMLILSSFTIGMGFLVSPCNPLEIEDPSTFKTTCVGISAFQLFLCISTFVWKSIESLHICHLVAKACYQRMNKDESRLPALEKIAAFKEVKLERTFSRDLETEREAQEQKKLQMLKENLHDEAMREREWYITVFSNPHPPLLLVFLFGYLPGLLAALISIVSKTSIEFPQNFTTEGCNWRNITGLDTYCWPGVNSGMVWYLVALVPLFILVSTFFRAKAIQMIRILKGNPLKNLKNQSMSTITQWQRQMSSAQVATQFDDFYIKSSALTLFIITVAWTLGVLHSIFAWGMSIPFGVVCFLQGLIHMLSLVRKTTQ